MITIAAYVYPGGLERLTGVSMLTLNMVRLLAKHPEVHLRLLAPANELEQKERMPADLGLDGIPVIPLPWKRSIREGSWLALNAPSIDRYLPRNCWIYCSREIFIPTKSSKRIVTVHHLEPEPGPLASSAERLMSWRRDWRLRKATTSAEVVVAQSMFTKAQVSHRYGVPPDRIHVVGSGVDDELLEKGASNWHPESMPYEPYVVSAGAFGLRKGTDYLLALARELGRRKSPLRIVCPYGKQGTASFVQEAESLPNMVVLDYMPRESLLACIRRAVCMVIPSRLEGFGLTAIESMALATPVVASNNSALPETLGEAGILVDPNCAASFADAVEMVFQSPKVRDQMAAAGLKRAQYFTWTKCMERLLSPLRPLPCRADDASIQMA